MAPIIPVKKKKTFSASFYNKLKYNFFEQKLQYTPDFKDRLCIKWIVISKKLFMCCVSVQMSVVREKYDIVFKTSRNFDSTIAYLASMYVLMVFLHGTFYKGFNLCTIFLKSSPSTVEKALLSLHKKYAIESVMHACCVPPTKKNIFIRKMYIYICLYTNLRVWVKNGFLNNCLKTFVF